MRQIRATNVKHTFGCLPFFNVSKVLLLVLFTCSTSNQPFSLRQNTTMAIPILPLNDGDSIPKVRDHHSTRSTKS